MSSLLSQSRSEQWRAVAKHYPIRSGPSVPPVKAMLEWSNEAWPFSKATAILDTGCGPGVVMANLLWTYGNELPENTRLLCSDFSDAMTEQVNSLREDRVAAGEKIFARLETEVLDAQNLSTIASGSLSHVTGGYVYFMLPDPPKALAETKRVLCEGGVFAQSSWHGNSWTELLGVSLRSVRPDANYPKIEGPWTTVEGVRGELEKAGFRDIHVEYVPTYLDVEDFDKTVRMMVGIPVIKLVVEQWSEEEVKTFESDFARRLKEACKESTRMKGTALASVARK